jgi:hypothetical protein
MSLFRTMLIAAPSSESSVLDFAHPDLLAAYTMDNLSGIDPLDESPSSNNATGTGSLTYATGLDSNAAVLDGTTTDIDISSWFPDTPSSYGLSFWAKADANGVTSTLFSHRPNGGVAQILTLLQQRDDNTVRVVVYDSNEFNHTDAYSSVVDFTTWHNFVLNFNQGGAIELYIDGVLEITSTATNVAHSGAITKLGVNDFGTGILQWFSGQIDQCRIFNRALTSDEATSLAGEFDPAALVLNYDNPDLTFLYTMDNISGSTLVDESPNANDGAYLTASPVAGVDGNAALFTDGATERITTTGHSALGEPNEFSFSGWINLSEVTTFAIVYGMRNSVAGSWLLFAVNGGNLILNCRDSNLVTQGTGSTIPLSINTPYHVVLNFDKDGDISIYLDGILVDTVTPAFTGNLAASMSTIGCETADNGTSFIDQCTGWIDQCRVFNRLLTSDEVTALAGEFD